MVAFEFSVKFYDEQLLTPTCFGVQILCISSEVTRIFARLVLIF